MKRKFNSLYWKISAIFLVLLLALGIVQLRIARRASRELVVETDQKLNRGLARDLAARFRPFLEDSLDHDAIEHTFHELMVMNPRVEIYLLDEAGRLLAYFADPERIKRTAVDIAPIERFLDEEDPSPLPLYGDDPRSPDRKKPFSATTVVIGRNRPGYLYVILGGEQYDSVASMLKGSYIAKTSLFVLGGSFAFTGLAGLVLFFLLTRRLREMTTAVGRFEQGQYQQRIAVSSEDEIGQLGAAFNQMADSLVAAMEEMRRNDSLRRELVANVSHDLRTPLTCIQGYLETVLMKDAGLSQEGRRHLLDIIYRNVTMLSRLVDELFELSKLEARQIQPRPESFSLTELVQDTVLDFQPQAEKGGVRLRAILPEDLPLVSADIGMIERTLTNLVENALHHTPDGGEVVVELARRQDGVRVIVSDTGRGIASEDLPHLFERFYRAEKDGARLSGGTGLGLAIAREIVEAHGSCIEVESEEGAGTTFAFALAACGEG